MGVVTFTDDLTSPIAAGRLFKALVVDADNLIPKLIPQGYKNVELVEGSGGPGSIKKVNLPEGKYIKTRTEELDQEKMVYKYKVIEGGSLGAKIESITYDVKFESLPAGGCKTTNICKYHTKPGVELKEEDVKADKENGMAIYKAVEAHLVANPQAYA